MIPFERTGHLLEYLINGNKIYSDFHLGVKNVCKFTITQRQSQGSAYYDYANHFKNLMMNRDKIKPIRAYIPVLTMVGENDNIGHTNRGDISKLCREQNVEFELVKGEGHWFFQTKSKYINNRIYNFLKY
tara:strand:- start:146 stop:535 length:390 start_codon:yes stop_codon:yes gene_type:complete